MEKQKQFELSTMIQSRKMINTIKLNPKLNRIMNGHIGGGIPKNKVYQEKEKENQIALVQLFPKVQYKKRLL